MLEGKPNNLGRLVAEPIELRRSNRGVTLLAKRLFIKRFRSRGFYYLRTAQ